MQRSSRMFNTLTINHEIDKNKKKGRCTELINKRNESIYYRYYFYGKIKKLTYADTFMALSNEFYLSERTIADIIQKASDKINIVFKEKLNIKQLTQKFYYLNWKNN